MNKIGHFLLKLFDRKGYDAYNEKQVQYNSDSIAEKVSLQNSIENMINDGTVKKTGYLIDDFLVNQGYDATKGIYKILNEYYISVLSELIYKGDYQEISKLKYLQIVIINLKNLLDNYINDEQK